MKSVSQTAIKANKFYTLTAACGLVMEAAEPAENGAAVQLGAYNHDPRQEWSFVRVGDATYHLINRGTGKALDLVMAGSADGTWLHQWDSAGSSSQMWIVEPTSDGHVKLHSQLAATRCIDVVGMSSEVGARLQIWQDMNGENQLWTLTAVVAKRTRKTVESAEAAAEEKPVKKCAAKKADTEATAAPAEKKPLTRKTAVKKAEAPTEVPAADEAAPKKRTRKTAKKTDAE